MSEWISVEEKLPEYIQDKDYSENVFVLLNNKLEVMCRVFGLADDGWVWANCYGNIHGDGEYDDDYNPTHWQHLPKPLEHQKEVKP